MVLKGKGILDPGECTQFDGVQEQQIHPRKKGAEAFASSGGRSDRPGIQRAYDGTVRVPAQGQGQSSFYKIGSQGADMDVRHAVENPRAEVLRFQFLAGARVSIELPFSSLVDDAHDIGGSESGRRMHDAVRA